MTVRAAALRAAADALRERGLEVAIASRPGAVGIAVARGRGLPALPRLETGRDDWALHHPAGTARAFAGEPLDGLSRAWLPRGRWTEAHIGRERAVGWLERLREAVDERTRASARGRPAAAQRGARR